MPCNNTYKISVNTILTAVGNYRVVSFQEPFDEVLGITNFLDFTGGGTQAVEIQRSFRWSHDDIKWSLWVPFEPSDASSPNISPLLNTPCDPFKPLHLEFKYQAIAVPGFSPALENGQPFEPEIVIEQIQISFDFKKTDPFLNFKPVHSLCSDQHNVLPVLFNKNFTFNPYNVPQAVGLYKDLSLMVNNLFGHEVIYYRKSPINRGTDVIIKEFNLYNVEKHQCVKILVPNNEFPDSKFNFNQFGIDFEAPFEIHMDKGYFESFFGHNRMPQKEDIIYFPLMDRVFEIQSSYIYRDFMYRPLYFKCQLIKYQPRANALMSKEIEDEFAEFTITTEQLFGKEVEKEELKTTKPQQYVTITHTDDPIRSMVNRNLPIDGIDLRNNWTLIASHFYDMTSLFVEAGPVAAIYYRAGSALDLKSSRSYTCWFQVETNTKTTDPTRNLLSGINSSGVGMAIDLIRSASKGSPDQIKLTLNETPYVFNLAVPLVNCEWYALVVNWSNEFLQASVDLWQMQVGTSQLLHLSNGIQTIALAQFDAKIPLTINASALQLTNVRLFTEMMEVEEQNLVLNQYVVKDNDKAIIIDNAKPLLRLPFVGNPK